MSSENPKTIVVSAVGDAILMVIVIQLTNVLAIDHPVYAFVIQASIFVFGWIVVIKFMSQRLLVSALGFISSLFMFLANLEELPGLIVLFVFAAMITSLFWPRNSG